MAKVGLKATMALLAKGYSKKEIDALAAVDDELEKEEAEKKKVKDPEPKPEEKKEEAKDPEPDYKKLYEDLLNENKEKDEQIKEIQKDNIHENVLPELEQSYEEERASLIDSIRSFY